MNYQERVDAAARQTRLRLHTQKQDVERHLRLFKSITPQGALAKYGSMRLGSIIHRLRREGWQIRTIREGAQGYARYCLVAEPKAT
jgi:hypothetical protein